MNISITSPLAADEEKILTRAVGKTAAGKPIISVVLPIKFARNVRKPEELRTPTAIIKPMRVGTSLTTIVIPSVAPCMKSE